MTDITEPTLKLCWNDHAIRRAAEVLRAAGLQLMAEDVEAQSPPKPTPLAEPTGDVAVFRSGWFYKPGGNKGWVRDDLQPFGWDEITHGSPEDLAIYRREFPQSDATGALPTSPSPEVGVGTSPPVASPAEEPRDGWRQGFIQGTLDTRQRIYNRHVRLRKTLITAPEQNAIDKALALIEADVEVTP